MVERAAVNRDVVGSSPTSGAIFYALVLRGFRRKREAFLEQLSAEVSAKIRLQR
jgi:hypothetical protein